MFRSTPISGDFWYLGDGGPKSNYIKTKINFVTNYSRTYVSNDCPSNRKVNFQYLHTIKIKYVTFVSGSEKLLKF